MSVSDGITAHQHIASLGLIFLVSVIATFVVIANFYYLLSIRKELTMSQSEPLALAVSRLSTSVAALATAVGNITATQTPDVDVTAAITAMGGISTQIDDIVAALAPKA